MCIFDDLRRAMEREMELDQRQNAGVATPELKSIVPDDADIIGMADAESSTPMTEQLDAFEPELRAHPGDIVEHFPMNFTYSGDIFFDGGQFYEEIWQFGQIVDRKSNESLSALYEEVTNEYGE